MFNIIAAISVVTSKLVKLIKKFGVGKCSEEKEQKKSCHKAKYCQNHFLHYLMEPCKVSGCIHNVRFRYYPNKLVVLDNREQSYFFFLQFFD